MRRAAPRMKSGGALLSHAVASAVPSGLRSLTAVFGMRTGVASSLWPPERVPGRLPAREALPAGSAVPNVEGLAIAVSDRRAEGAALLAESRSG